MHRYSSSFLLLVMASNLLAMASNLVASCYHHLLAPVPTWHLPAPRSPASLCRIAGGPHLSSREPCTARATSPVDPFQSDIVEAG